MCGIAGFFQNRKYNISNETDLLFSQKQTRKSKNEKCHKTQGA